MYLSKDLCDIINEYAYVEYWEYIHGVMKNFDGHFHKIALEYNIDMQYKQICKSTLGELRRKKRLLPNQEPYKESLHIFFKIWKF